MKFSLKDALAVKEFCKLPVKRVNYVKRMGVISCYGRVIMRSPVLTGRYRGGWNCSINGIDYTVPSPAPKEFIQKGNVYYQIDSERAKKFFAQVTISENCFISNSVPYAEHLENGHSKQAPNGVMRITILEVKEDLKKFARQAKRMDGGF